MEVRALARAIGFAALGTGALLLLAVPPASLPGPPAPGTQARAGRKPVRFWHMWTGEWKDVIEEITAAFNASQSEYEVIPLSLPSSGSSKLLLGVVGGDPPDVMAQWDSVIPTWASRGAIEPLDRVATPSEMARIRREIFPLAWKSGAFKGRLYALTASLNAFGLYISTDALREIGLPPDWTPKTLEEVSAVGRRLDRRDRSGRLTRIGFLPGSWRNLAPLFEGGFYDWRRGELTLDTPANVASLAFLRAERAVRGVAEYDRFASGFGPDFGAQWAFLQGQIAMDVNGAWRVEQIRKYAPTFRYRAMPLPPPAGGRPNGGYGNGNPLIIPAGAREKRGALAFMMYWGGLTDPEAAAVASSKGGWLPMTRATAASRTFAAYSRANPQWRSFLRVTPSENLQPLPPITVQNFLADKISEWEDRAVRGRVSPAEAVRSLAAVVAEEIARRKRLGDAE